MAIGGPETPYTLEQLPAEEIQQGQAAASMPAMSTPLGAGLDTAQTPLNPAAQQQSNLKTDLQGPQLRGDRFRGDRWHRNEEFYSGQERPAQYQASGGDPIWVASGGRVPMGILAERQSQLQAKKAELNKFIQSRYDPFKGKADPRYEQKYQQYVRGEMDKYIQDYANANTGGNLNEAYKQIYSNPDARAAYEAKVADWEAIGAANKTAVPMALDLLKGVYQNELQASPETMQLARQLATGMMEFGNGISSAERADAAWNFERSLSKDKWWADFGSKAMKEAGDVLQQQGDVVYPGGHPFLRQRKQEIYDRFIQQAVQHGVANGFFDSPQEAMEFIQARTPSSDVTELSQLRLGSGGDGSTAPVVAGTIEVGPDITSRDQAASVVTLPKGIAGEPIESRAPNVARVAVTRKDGAPFTSPMQFRDAGGRPTSMIPSHIITEADGAQYIVGVDPTTVEVVKTKEAELAILDSQIAAEKIKISAAINGRYLDQNVSEIEAGLRQLAKRRADIENVIRKVKPTIRVPVQGNTSTLNMDYGAIKGRAMQAFGGQGKITPEQFNQQWSKLPKGGKLVGPDGVEYTKQ